MNQRSRVPQISRIRAWCVYAVAMLEDTITHMAARGSNALIGRNILQTMTFMTPDEYEQMQALNAWTGRRDLIGLRHVDEFNQSAGRNLGFRRRGNVEHHLLVNRRLFELLATSSAQVLGRPSGPEARGIRRPSR
uniref:hypothetical protein n=1 Tax=Methylobacterium radiotolerans TaxID=31998 RepID=UPI002F35D546